MGASGARYLLMKGNACGAIRAGADQWRGLTKTEKKGNANQLESLFALTPVSLFPLITCSLRVIRAGYTTTKVDALYSQPGGAPDPAPLSSVWGFIRQKSYILNATGRKISMLILSVSASLSFLHNHSCFHQRPTSSCWLL